MQRTDNRKVWLWVKGNLDTDETADGVPSEFSTEGEFYREEDAACLTYQESEVSGMGKTTTTVRVDGGMVSVIRLGEVNSVMEFEKGKRKVSLYETPYGELSLTVYTRDVVIEYAADDNVLSHIKVDYDLDIRGFAHGNNVIDITVICG